MNNKSQSSAGSPVSTARILHTMIRIGDIERSLAFYVGALGMQELRREDYPEGRFTLVFVGYGDEASTAVIELTHNWDENDYRHGNGFGHIAIGLDDIYAVCECLAAKGVKMVRQPGPMSVASDTGNRDVIAFIEDPDGYRIELINREAEYEHTI